ncbi:MAG: histidine phosphatase family protein [Vicinamibacteria bacterium]
MGEERFQLILVRHGLTDWNEEGKLIGRSGVPLNERGGMQAAAAAEALKSFPVRAVISSPERRTLETAGPIASEQGLEVEIDADFDEVWLTEPWLGKTVPELQKDPEFARSRSDPGYRSPCIESIESVRDRVVAGVERLRKERAGETLVVVSHGDPLRAIVAHYLGMPIASLRRLLIDNGSVSILRFNPLGPQLTLLNWKPTLA